MRKILLSVFMTIALLQFVDAQTIFDETIEVPAGYNPTTVVMPPSPLSMQVLFIGNTDMVQTTPTYGNPAGETPAKQWHDFIGFTPDTVANSDDFGWVTVNHEMIQKNDQIGDGGGMTSFKIRRDANTDTFVVVDQTLADGREGKFFNVDFVNVTGETGMNCGGIQGNDGRIWTAEEWFRTDNSSINAGGDGVRDIADKILFSDQTGWASDVTVEAYENFNYMVEIDPREAVAIRKQYNWGRQGFEGGTILPDNKTVFLGWDGSPGFITKFVADVAGDFTEGTLYVYKQDAVGDKWIAIDNTADNMLGLFDVCESLAATLVARIEWVDYVPATGKVYMTETGRDNIGDRWDDEVANGAVIAKHHESRATEQGLLSPADPAYADYYGRVLEFDPVTDELREYIAGGPAWPNETSPNESDYFGVHLSNPDGLTHMTIGGKPYMVICEDLNGSSYGRVPEGTGNRTCEMFLLDMSISSPKPSDLIRISVVPTGAEITGARPTPDGKSLLVNSQHPAGSNPFPFNNSLTYAIHGFDALTTSIDRPALDPAQKFSIYPNPSTQIVYFNQIVDAAIYNVQGQRLKVYRQVNNVDLMHFQPGIYFIKTGEGDVQKLIIQK